MRKSREGGKLNPAIDDRRPCKKNSPSVFILHVRRQKKAMIVAAKMDSLQGTRQERAINLLCKTEKIILSLWIIVEEVKDCNGDKNSLI